MKLLIQTAIMFFGTLLAAALLALGDPGSVVPTILHGESAHAAPAANNVAVADWPRLTDAAQPAHLTGLHEWRGHGCWRPPDQPYGK